MEAEVFVENGYVAIIVPYKTASIIRKLVGMQAGGSRWSEHLFAAMCKADIERYENANFVDSHGNPLTWLKLDEE